MQLFPSPKASNKDALISTVGAALAMAITWLVCEAMLDSVAPILALSMGASAVILFTMPTAPAAQPACTPTAIPTASAVLSMSCADRTPKNAATQWATINGAGCAAGAVGVHAGLMVRFGYMHPPSGGTALTAVIGGEAVTKLGYTFIWRPVLLNALLLVLLAIVINAPFAWRRYPAKN